MPLYEHVWFDGAVPPVLPLPAYVTVNVLAGQLVVPLVWYPVFGVNDATALVHDALIVPDVVPLPPVALLYCLYVVHEEFVQLVAQVADAHPVVSGLEQSFCVSVQFFTT